MDLLRISFTYLMSLISLEPPVPTGSEITGIDPDDGYGISGRFDFVAFFNMIQEGLYGGGELLLHSMLDLLHPVLNFHELTLIILLIMVMVYVIYWTITSWAKKRTISRMGEEENRKLEMLLADILLQEEKICMLEQENTVLQHEKEHLELQSKIMREKQEAKDQCQEADSAPQASGSEHHEPEVKCVPRSEKPMTWKTEERKRSNDILKMQHEKEDLELQSVILQENLEAKDQSQEADSAPQASGSEHHESEVKCVPRSEKLMTWKTEERKRSNDILKMEIELHKKRAEETLIGTRIAELTLVTEREEKAKIRQCQEANSAPQASGSEHHEPEVKCVPRSEKPMTWKTEEGKRSNDILKMEHEKEDLELQSVIMQEKLEAKDQCQEADSAPQASGSEHHEPEAKCVPRSEKLMTWKTEERKRSNDILKMEMELHKKRAEETLIGVRVAELALANEREENAKLRQKFIQVNAELAEIRDPVTVPPLKKDGIASCRLGKAALEESTEKLQGEKILQLEDKIKTMENDRASLNNEITNQGNLYKILQEKLLIMDTLCQEKDYTLQQMLALEEVEQHVKHIKSAGPKQEVRNFKQRIQEINAKHEKAQDSLKKEIYFHKKTAEDNWVVACASKSALTTKRKEVAILTKKLSEFSASMAGYQEPVVSAISGHSDPRIRPLNKDGTVTKITRAAVTTFDKSTQAQSSDQLQWYRCQAELADEKTKVEKLGAKIRAMEEKSEACRKEMLKLALQNRTFQKEVQSLAEQCKQKDQALQLKTAQVDFERRDKELKVKEVLKVHKLKVQSIVEEHQKSELSYKAEIESLKKSQDKLMKTCASGRAQMTNLYKQLDSRAASVATPDSCQETPREKKTVATQASFRFLEKTAKLPNAAEHEQSLHLKKLQLEEKRSQLLEEKIQTLEQNRNALMSEKSLLEDQNAALQSKLLFANERLEQIGQTLQLSAVQTDVELEAEIQALALNVRVMGEELESQGCYKAQMELQERQAQENMTMAMDISVTQAETIADLQNELAEANAKLAKLWKADPEATPDSCQETPREKKTVATQASFRFLEKTVKLPNAAEDKQSLHLKKFQLEEKRSQLLEEKIQTLEQNRNALMSEKSLLEDQNAALQSKLLFANERLEQIGQTLQLSAVQTDVELEAEIQALALNVRVMGEELESQGCYKAQMELQERQAQENMTMAMDISVTQAETIADLQNELAEANAKLAKLWKADPEATPDSCQETPREKKTVATQASFRFLEKTVKLPNAAEDKQSLHLKKLQLEEKRSQLLEEKIQTLEQNRNALMSEKSLLKDQNAALQSELLFANERFEQRSQAFQLSAVQTDVELEAEIQALALNVRLMSEELESQGCYKAQMEFQERQAQENMMIAMDISEAQAETIADLQNELAEANAKLSKLWKDDPEAGPSFSYQALPFDSEDVPLPGPSARSPGFSVTHLRPPLPRLGEFEGPRPPDLSARSSYDFGGFCKVPRLPTIAEEPQLPLDFGETEGWERGGEAE